MTENSGKEKYRVTVGAWYQRTTVHFPKHTQI